MRRTTLSTKLIAAALPLVVAVMALLALTVRADLGDARRAENGAELGAVWNPLIDALAAIEAESASAAAPAAGDGSAAATRRATDQALNDLRTDVESLGASEAAGAHITSGRSALSAARRNLDMATVAPELQSEIDPFEAYDLASRELVAVGQLLPSEAGDPVLGRELLAVVKLAEAKLGANAVIAGTSQWAADPTDQAALATARSAFGEMEATLGEFEAIAPADWAAQYRQSGFPTELSKYRGDLDRAVRSGQTGQSASFDTESFAELVDRGVQFQSAISQEIVDSASLEADTTRQSTLIRIGISLVAVLLAALTALFITRSITRRIKAVSQGANQVADEQLPALVEALRDPRGKTVLPDIAPVDARGHDELAELANAFNSMQSTLVDVAHEQVEVMRRGVSDLFVTMARRNRSLIDRQLAMLDEYEAEVDDPDVLANYYQLDHLATRMRRNSESLLVLASAEPKRRRVKATEIDDVVRASIGEIEDYRRVEIEHLESLQVRGTVVADISHLIAELLDNATAFSPPESSVRIGGRHAGDSYLLRVVDSGIGIPTQRLAELNELLREPPVVGLSVEPTLGMSVVSLLAYKHGIHVTLSAGSPGLTVDITLPSTLFGPIDVPLDRGAATYGPSTAPLEDESIVAWSDNDRAGAAFDEAFQPVAAADTIGAPRSAQPTAPYGGHPEDEERVVTASDWTKMAASLSAFKSGQQSATDMPATFAYDETFDTTGPVTAYDDDTNEFTGDQLEPIGYDDDTNEIARPVTAYDESFDTGPTVSTYDDISDYIAQPVTAFGKSFDSDQPGTDEQPEPIAYDDDSGELTDDITQPVTTHGESFDAEPTITDDQLEPIAHDDDTDELTDDITQPVTAYDESFDAEPTVTDDQLEPIAYDDDTDEFTDDITQPVTTYDESFDTDQPITDSELEPIAYDDVSDIAQPVTAYDDISGELTDDIAQPVAAYDESFVTDQPVTDDELEPIAYDDDTDEFTDDIAQPAVAHRDITDETAQPITAYGESFDAEPRVTELEPAATASDTTDLAEIPVGSALVDLPPPPPATRVHGEFDTPLAPPITADGPSRRPVTPESALSANPRPLPDQPSLPSLPTRSPSSGPDGPDRLIDFASTDNRRAETDPSSPGALQAALAAFDAGFNGSNGSLPTRARTDDPTEHVEEPLATTPSRLDPDALRQRLRAFQSEFRTGLDDRVPDPDDSHASANNHSDLGGDRR